MKKIIVVATVVIAVAAFVPASYAGQNNYGCGLGSLIFKGNDGLVSQTCAATTNGIFGNQTFGITSGTLNCAKFQGLVSNEKINIFVAENMDNLAKDIAKGNGEYLNTLAVLMEVKEGERSDLYKKLQSNFSKIYSSDQITHIDVINNIETVIKSS